MATSERTWSRVGQPAAALLPHDYPMLLLDRILLIEPGVAAVAVKNLTPNDPLMAANGQWPNVLLAEAIAQTAGIAAALPADAGGPAMLAAIDRFRCRTVVAGDTLVVTARVVRRFGALAKVRAAVRAGTRHCAAAEVTLRFGAGPR